MEQNNSLIKHILLRLQVDLSKVKFVKGSDFQLTKEYTIDVYKFMSKITVDAAQKGGAEVVKQSDNPALSGLAYPLLQVLDEVYLQADAELGGQDQRKIFMLSRDHIHKLGYTPSIHLMNPMIPSITAKNISSTNTISTNTNSTNADPETNSNQSIQPEHIDKYIEQINKLKSKNLSWDNFISISSKIASDLKNKNVKNTGVETNKMSSSDANSKIDFLESDVSVRKKISKAFAEPTNTSNTLFLFLQYVIFPANKLVSIDKFVIERDEKYGGILEYSDLETIKADYTNNKLSPPDLKQGISDWLVNFLLPVREHFQSEELVELVKQAYPE